MRNNFNLPNIEDCVVSIIGLGYVGLPLAIEFGKKNKSQNNLNLEVIGFDINKKRINEMVPFNGGGEMIKSVTKDDVIYNKSPFLFEAGTPGIAEIIGLGAAIDFVQNLDRKSVLEYEKSISDYTRTELEKLDWLVRHCFHKDNLAIFSFSMEGSAHAHDMATILDANGVAVRSGHHCAQPLMDFIGVPATCRASLALYNTEHEINALIGSLMKCKKLFD